MITVVFQNGNITVSATSADAFATYKVGVTGPLGVIKVLPGTPDGMGTTFSISIPIPLNIDDSEVEGDYTVNVIIDDSIGITNRNGTFCYRKLSADLDVEVGTDCYAKVIFVKDNTAYADNAVIDRLVTIDFPVVPGEEERPDVTGTGSTVQASLAYPSGIAYENIVVNVNVNVTVTVSETVDTIQFSNVFDASPFYCDLVVVCNNDKCGVISCVDKEYTRLIAQACKCGGISSLPKADADKLSLIQAYLSMYNFWLGCKDQERIKFYYGELQKLVKCDCDEPKGPVAISDSDPIYIQGPSAYEVWLNAGNTGTVEDFLAALFPVGEWTDIDAGFFRNDLEHGTMPLQYRLLKAHIEFRGMYKRIIGGIPTPANPYTVLDAAFNPGAVDPQGYAIVHVGGDQTAMLFRDTDNDWKVSWSSRYNVVPDNIVFGQIPLVGGITGTLVQNIHDWTEFPLDAYNNGHTPIGALPFQWRSDGRFMYFRGTFKASAMVSSGLEVIKASYFNGLGLSLETGTALALIDGSEGGSPEGGIGFVKVEADNLVAFVDAAEADVSNPCLVVGLIPMT